MGQRPAEPKGERKFLPILDRFILGQMVGPFFFGMMAFTVILVAGGLLFKLADLVIQRGVPLWTVTRLFVYSLPGVIVLTIPMSCLLSSLLGFGGMSANSELVALKSSGISFGRIARPVVIASIFISMTAFMINETIVPLSERAAANVLRYEVFNNTPPLFKERVFVRDESEGVLRRVLYIGKLSPNSGEMSDILLQEFSNGKISNIISAPRAEWRNGAWIMYNGRVFEVRADNSVALLFDFDKQTLNIASAPDELDLKSNDPSEMSLSELRATIKSAEIQGNDTNSLRMTMHLRIAIPWASVVLALVGASVGSRPQRSSSGIGLGLSVIIVFCYYVIMSMFKAFGEAAYIPVTAAAWAPNAIFLVIGAILAKRANRLG
ncbi:LPS export ABC transporter permease LptG [Synergistales bacterium]|nr:LPS export ABC transporter permease LptG [Synergistales bacterium]